MLVSNGDLRSLAVDGTLVYMSLVALGYEALLIYPLITQRGRNESRILEMV